MELSTEAPMKTRKGSLTGVAERISPPPSEKGRSKSQGRDVVTMTIRFSREAWREVHDMAMSDDVSINTLVLNALNREREARGLAPLKPVPTGVKQ